MYKEHELRVIEEKKELDKKTDKLFAFIHGPVFNAVSTDEQMLLKEQHDIMTDYSMILGERISLFGEK